MVCGHLDIDWDDLSGALFGVELPGDAVNGPWRETRYVISEQRKKLDKRQRPRLSQLLVYHHGSRTIKA